MIDAEEGRICRIYAIANPDKLGAVGASLCYHDTAAHARAVYRRD
jgi:hypothetical protein